MTYVNSQPYGPGGPQYLGQTGYDAAQGAAVAAGYVQAPNFYVAHGMPGLEAAGTAVYQQGGVPALQGYLAEHVIREQQYYAAYSDYLGVQYSPEKPLTFFGPVEGGLPPFNPPGGPHFGPFPTNSGLPPGVPLGGRAESTFFGPTPGTGSGLPPFPHGPFFGPFPTNSGLPPGVPLGGSYPAESTFFGPVLGTGSGLPPFAAGPHFGPFPTNSGLPIAPVGPQFGPFGGGGGLPPFPHGPFFGPFGSNSGLPPFTFPQNGPFVGGLPRFDGALFGPFPGGLPAFNQPVFGPFPGGLPPFGGVVFGPVRGGLPPFNSGPVLGPFPSPGNAGSALGTVTGTGSVAPSRWGTWQHVPPGPEINTSIDFTKLSSVQRTQLSGLSDRERGVLHLWGIQMTSAGRQDGGIYLNVMNDPGKFKPAEVQLAQELAARDRAQYGGITGKALDQEFFALMQKISGEDVSQRYGGAPVHFAQGPVDMEKRLVGDNGMNAFENAVIRLWGHEPLFNGGRIDGSILSYTLDSPTSLDFNLNRQDVQTLLTADLSADGVRDGDMLGIAFGDVLDKLYLGGQGTSQARVTAQAQQIAAQGRTFGGSIPPGGDPNRYFQMAQALGPELSAFDAALNEISGLAGVTPQNGNLDGRFENGLFLRQPADRNEFASYNRAQLLGGALEGRTTIFQRDAIPGTRYAQVEDPTLFHAATARMYAYQFAAYARGYDPLAPEGMASGANAFQTMAPDSRVFMQVAAIFKGNMLGGPDNYDNPIARNLLLQAGQTDLANQPGVGQSDVQTIGAVAAALDRGALRLTDVLGSGFITAQDMPRYMDIIGYVVQGGFNQDLGRYDAIPINGGVGGQGGSSGSAGVGGSAYPGTYQPGPGVDGLYGGDGPNPHQARLDALKQNPLVSGFYAMFDLNGDGRVLGPESGAAVSNLNDLVNLMLSGAQPGPNAPAAVRMFFQAHDFNRDGLYNVDEARTALRDLAPVMEAIKLDQFSLPGNQERPVQYGAPLGLDPAAASRIARCPVLGPQLAAQGMG